MKTVALIVAVLLAGPAAAQEKKAKPAKKFTPIGSWKKLAGDYTLTFTFKKGNKYAFSLKDSIGDGLMMEGKYKIGKGGKVAIKADKVNQKGEFPKPPRGAEYTFKLVPQGKTKVRLKDLKGEGADEAAALVEGVYTLKTD